MPEEPIVMIDEFKGNSGGERVDSKGSAGGRVLYDGLLPCVRDPYGVVGEVAGAGERCQLLR